MGKLTTYQQLWLPSILLFGIFILNFQGIKETYFLEDLKQTNKTQL